MRQLILHIGPGKSGSSALQSWLAVNQQALARLGYGYHVSHPGARALQVNAGNAGPLREQLREASFPAGDFEKQYFRGLEHAIISGEQLQLLDSSEARVLLDWASRAGIEVTVIGFLRNAYDYLYSTWLQTIKRRNQAKPFDEFVERLSRFRHLDVVDHWEALAPSRWLHYDTERDRLADAFCERTGLDAAALAPMSSRRVNRSLTLEEAAVLQALVRWQQGAGLGVQDDFSRIICDDLVNQDPQRPVGFRFDEPAHAHMIQHFADALRRFNETIGAREGLELSILGETRYASMPEHEGLDPETLARIVEVMETRRERFDPRALGVISEAMTVDHPGLAARVSGR